jgi:hypothetical protein
MGGGSFGASGVKSPAQHDRQLGAVSRRHRKGKGWRYACEWRYRLLMRNKQAGLTRLTAFLIRPWNQI